MKRIHVFAYFTVMLSCCAVVPVHAQPLQQDQSEQAARMNRLQQTVDAQQKQLDAQQVQLEKQRQALHQLQQQLSSGLTVAAELPVIGSIPRRNDLQTSRRDDAQALEDWQGSFAVQGSDTRIKIGGFVELDIIHDSHAIGSKGQFIASSIPTRNATSVDGDDGQTNFSIAPSRLFVETRTPIDDKRLKTFISIDMFGDELEVDPRPRLRQAYVEITNSLFGGDLLMGQAWSTTTDLESTPDVLDFRGVDSLFGRLQPQLRWTRPISNNLRLMLAAETASNHIIEGADSLTGMPDIVMALGWTSKSFKLTASLIAKDLRASLNNGPVESVVGFGGNISGKVTLPFDNYPDDVMFSVSYGRGIGSQFNNAQADAVYDSSNDSLQAIHLYGVTLGYTHNWNASMKSSLVYCCIEIDNEDAQAAEAVQGTEYTSGNFVWNMNTRWLLGIEGIWGKRKDKDDALGTTFRTQLTSRVSF